MFKNIKSCIKKYHFTNIEKLIDDIKEYDFAIIYNLACVKTLYARHVTKKYLPNDFLEVRAFNENAELRVIEVSGEYIGRIRTDCDGEDSTDVEILDECHLLWGKYICEKDEYTYLSEDRGTQLKIPLNIKEKERAFVTVRNYLNTNKDVFEFNDYRMMKFFAKEATEYDEQK